MTVNHGFAIPLGRNTADLYLQNLVKELIASGFISNAIEKHQIKGLAAVKISTTAIQLKDLTV
jgi:hypothetical protein